MLTLPPPQKKINDILIIFPLFSVYYSAKSTENEYFRLKYQ